MIYLDNNATTRPDATFLGQATSLVLNGFGNPSSIHAEGYRARDLIETARQQVAASISARPHQIIFTSGGTEANNLCLAGFCGRLHRVSSSSEHSSVFNFSKQEVITITQEGLLDFDSIDFGTLGPDTIVSVMLASNETGVLLDESQRLIGLKQKYGFLLHVDAIQAFGKLSAAKPLIDVKSYPVDFLSLSAHKFGGLKGVGALFISDAAAGLDFQPQTVGGSHELGYRAGTQNMLGIVNMGLLCQHLADSDAGRRSASLSFKRNLLESRLADISQVNGARFSRTANSSNLYFPSLPSDYLDVFLDALSSKGLMASARSACRSGFSEPSRTLVAMFGAESERVDKSIRLSLSHQTTLKEIEQAATIIRETVAEAV